MLTRSQSLIFLTGGFGGMAPSLFDLAERLSESPPDIPGLAYVGSLLILLAIGGGVALAFKETNYLKALLLGLTLPALVASFQSHRDIPTGSTTNGSENSFLLIPFMTSALAQSTQYIHIPTETVENTAQERTGERSLLVRDLEELEIEALKKCVKCWVWFYDGDGDLVARFPFDGESDGSKAFMIPKSADKFGVWNKSMNPYLWSLPRDGANGNLSFSFDYKYNPLKDFMRGFGFGWKSYDPKLQTK